MDGQPDIDVREGKSREEERREEKRAPAMEQWYSKRKHQISADTTGRLVCSGSGDTVYQSLQGWNGEQKEG
jgi:hypothetical protein